MLHHNPSDTATSVVCRSLSELSCCFEIIECFIWHTRHGRSGQFLFWHFNSVPGLDPLLELNTGIILYASDEKTTTFC